jgi:hypothetical protein
MPGSIEQAVTTENVEKHKQLTEGPKKVFAARRDVACYRYAKTGHYVKDCLQDPHPVDVYPRILIAPLDTEYSGVLGVDVLRHMEASVDLRTSTLVLGRKRYQLSGQEVERCSFIRRQCRLLQVASEPGLINPEKALTDGQAEVPIPKLSPGETDFVCWNIVALGSVVLPPRSEGLVIGRRNIAGWTCPGRY